MYFLLALLVPALYDIVKVVYDRISIEKQKKESPSFLERNKHWIYLTFIILGVILQILKPADKIPLSGLIPYPKPVPYPVYTEVKPKNDPNRSPEFTLIQGATI